MRWKQINFNRKRKEEQVHKFHILELFSPTPLVCREHLRNSDDINNPISLGLSPSRPRHPSKKQIFSPFLSAKWQNPLAPDFFLQSPVRWFKQSPVLIPP